MQDVAPRSTKPDLSVVVVVYGIEREAPRTLRSLSASYQRWIDADDYEVIVVDNGSSPPLDRGVLDALPGNFRLVRIDDAKKSPAAAVNRGIAEARADLIGVLVDGARMVTPGLLHFARHGARLFPQAVVCTLGWYLGSDFQFLAGENGYSKSEEDALLASIRWPEDGYRLFEIATFDESTIDGWFASLIESNALFLRREAWAALGGFDEAFTSPGGGLVNLDAYNRAIALPGAERVVLLGEATFHQLHGGVATNAPIAELGERLDRWMEEYEQIRGCRYAVPPQRPPTYLGVLPRAALTRFVNSALRPCPTSPAPLGEDFDQERWSLAPATRPADPAIAALVDLAQAEFAARRHTAAAAVARLVLCRSPREPEAARIAALCSPWLRFQGPAPGTAGTMHLALARAHAILGEPGAVEEHRTAAREHGVDATSLDVDEPGAADRDRMHHAVAQSSDPAALLDAATAANGRGDPLTARAHCERALAMPEVPRRAELLFQQGLADLLLGDRDGAKELIGKAFELSFDLPPFAHFYYADLLLPGPRYEAILSHLHALLEPRSYLEIGVANGDSIVLAKPPTVAVGIDPCARLTITPSAVTKVFGIPSDVYFEKRDPRADCEADVIDLAFIDGMHHFEQALRDFIHVERYSGPNTVALIHDTLAFDPRVAERERRTAFWTGDVWRVVAILREARPDLGVFTIATPPSGLTVVTGLDSTSTFLSDNLPALVTLFGLVDIAPGWAERREAMNTIPNDWPEIERRLAPFRRAKT